MKHGKPARTTKDEEVEVTTTSVPTLREFAPRFMDGYARANREKPSSVAGKESILRVHLLLHFGGTRLDEITTEAVQRLKGNLENRAPKTVNNVLTVLSVLLKVAVSWGVISRMPCVVTVVRTMRTEAAFLDFAAYDRLLTCARADGRTAEVIVRLGAEAGLRCGEMMALEWRDVDLDRRRLTVARSDWKGRVTAPKGGRVRHVPLTSGLGQSLRDPAICKVRACCSMPIDDR